MATGDLEAWGDALDHALLAPANGLARTPVGSSVSFRVQMACEDFGGLPEGDHEVHAVVRDLGLVALVEGEGTLSPSCDAPVFVESGSGRLLTEDETRDLVRGEPDAGAPTFDAGLGDMDGGARADAGAFDVGTSEPARGSCSAVRGQGYVALQLTVLASLMAARRRSRRR